MGKLIQDPDLISFNTCANVSIAMWNGQAITTIPSPDKWAINEILYKKFR